MNAPAPESAASHRHKLLTREDLVKLEIPAADVLQWLLAGSLCEAGSLPNDAGAGSVAVFAAPDPELRSELAERLAAIGRTDVALTRPQARAEVVRAVMAQRGLTPVATPLVEVEEVETGVEGEFAAAAGGDVEVEAAGSNAAGNDDADFFDADALVQELDAWTEPEGNDAELGEIEGESATMSATTDPLDAGATEAPDTDTSTDTTAGTAIDEAEPVADAAEEVPEQAAATDGPTDEDGAATLLEDLTVAADEFETPDDDTTDPEAAEDQDDTGTIDAFTGATIDELVEPGSETRSKPTLDLPGFDSPAADAAADMPEAEALAEEPMTEEAFTDERPSSEATMDDATVPEDATAAGPEAAVDAPADANADAGLGAETDEPFSGEDPLGEDPVDELPDEPSPTDELPEQAFDDAASAEPVDDDSPVDDPSPEAPSFEEPSIAEPAITEPAITEPAIEETPAAAAMAEPPPEDSAPPPAATATGASAGAAATEEAMTRVESFLGELRGALVDLAQRPPEAAQPVDMQPLVAAVGEFGQRVEHGVAVGVHAAMLNGGKPAEAPAPIQYVKAASSGKEITMLSVAFLILCWSGILWFKTGNAVLAIGTLVGANVIGCCLLARRR